MAEQVGYRTGRRDGTRRTSSQFLYTQLQDTRVAVGAVDQKADVYASDWVHFNRLARFVIAPGPLCREQTQCARLRNLFHREVEKGCPCDLVVYHVLDCF
jgi:hypothetical protein